MALNKLEYETKILTGRVTFRSRYNNKTGTLGGEAEDYPAGSVVEIVKNGREYGSPQLVLVKVDDLDGNPMYAWVTKKALR